MSGLWRNEIRLAEMPRLGASNEVTPFCVPRVDLSVLQRDWVVVPDAPLPNDLVAEILKAGTSQERALVTVANRLPATLGLVRPIHQNLDLPVEVIDLTLPRLAPQFGSDIREVVEPEVVLKGWFDKLPLGRIDYSVGTVVEAGPVRAAEVYTKPLQVESRDVGFDFGFAMSEDWSGIGGMSVVFDPVWWQVDDASSTFAAINLICDQSVRLQVLAERVSRIVTAIPKSLIESRMKAAGVTGNIVDYLVNEVVNKDPKRLAMRKLAMRAQLVAGRMAILEGMRVGLPSKALFLIAFSVDQWTNGGLSRLVNDKERDEVLTGDLSASLATELEEVSAKLKGVLSGQINNYVRAYN